MVFHEQQLAPHDICNNGQTILDGNLSEPDKQIGRKVERGETELNDGIPELAVSPTGESREVALFVGIAPDRTAEEVARKGLLDQDSLAR